MIQAVLGFLLKIGFGNIVDKTVEYLKVRGADGTEKERTRAQVEIAHIEAAVREYRTAAELQRVKLAVPAFWVLVIVMVAPLALKWTMLNLYDVFWCRDCMFPVGWTIAAYPSPFDRWAQSMFDWIFGPVGAAGAAAGAANALFGGRRK